MDTLRPRTCPSAAKRFALLLLSAAAAAFVCTLSACGPAGSPQRDAARLNEPDEAPRFSIVVSIRGDGEYLYHDAQGNERSADEDALAGAVSVARSNPTAEVLIFHERPERKLLFLWPLDDGEFTYYRNGRLAASETYRRGEASAAFSMQAELYRRFRAARSPEAVSMFLYFGHELPETSAGEADPERTFTVGAMADGLSAMTGDSARFDLVVLSSCFNGTPHTIAAVSPYARTVVASPDNLHLSYFDLAPFERLNVELQDGNVPAFARRFARHAFDRLAADLQTAVTVAVYDVDRVQGFLRAVDSADQRTSASGAKRTAIAMEQCDCAELGEYELAMMSSGVDIFFRPARFGRSKHKQTHSGWQCRTDRATVPPASRTAGPASR